ncbi:MAG: GatB/YqeY domain-containing protein [Caldithrix sp.]|nr:GatB/YqeY domain-containing protein [Caldithrix sp.]
MSIEAQINADMKNALKNGDKAVLATLRSLMAQIKDARIKKGREQVLDDKEVIQVINNAAKKRREAIEMYQKGKRDDLVQKESKELEVIKSYLPQQLSEEEITRMIAETIDQVGATQSKDLGKVMGVLMPKLQGKADGKAVQNMVRERLVQLEE